MHVRRNNIFAILSCEIDLCFADPFPFFNLEYRGFFLRTYLKAQKLVLQIMKSIKYNAHTEPSFIKSHLLNVKLHFIPMSEMLL